MSKKSIATIAIVAVIAVAAAVIGVGASRRSDSAGAPSGGASGAQQGAKGGPGAMKGGPGGMPGFGAQGITVKSVRAKAAASKTLRPYIDQGGDVESSVSMSVYPDIGGRIAEVAVAVGDAVRKGDQIASVDPSKPGSSYAISAVYAPISGTVTSILANPGETVSSGTAIAKVGVIDELEIVVNVPERDSAKIKKGMTARIALEALPGESLAATVVRVSPVLNPTSRTREATLELVAKDGRVAAGMYASVRIFTTPISGIVAVPAAAVVSRDEESFVYVVGDESGRKLAHKRTVKAGTAVDADIEIKEGLSAGELVVYEGQDLISDGAEVIVIGEGEK
jgi:membrane fusion protein, multidrug efflux system